MVSCVLSCLGLFWLLTCPVIPLWFWFSWVHADLQVGHRKSPLSFTGWTWLHSQQDGLRADLTQMNESWQRTWLQVLVEIIPGTYPVLLLYWCHCQEPRLTPFPSQFLTLCWLVISISHFYSDSSWELLSTCLSCLPHSFLTLFPTQTLPCSKGCRYLIVLKYCYLCFSQIFLGLDWTSAQHHMSSADIILLKSIDRSSSVVQWLRLCGCTAEGTVSIPVWGTLIPHAKWHGCKKRKAADRKMSYSTNVSSCPVPSETRTIPWT